MKKLGIFIIALLAVGVFRPGLAISENETETICDVYAALQSEEFDAVFTAFQGDMALEEASALLRARDSSGALPADIAARFSAAEAQVKSSAASRSRRSQMAKIRQRPDYHRCSAIE